MILEISFANSSIDRRRLSRCFILYEKTKNSIFNSSFSLFNILLFLIYDTQICFNTIESHHFNKRKEKEDKETSYNIDNIILYTLRSSIAIMSPTYFKNVASKTIIDVINTWHFFKRKASSANLNESKKSKHRLKKFRRAN